MLKYKGRTQSMPIKSIKDKISNMASGEILGETTEEEKRKQEEKERKARQPEPRKQAAKPAAKKKEPKPKREPKVKQEPKEKKVTRESLFKRKERPIIDESEPIVDKKKPKEENAKEDKDKAVIKEAVDGYEDVLSILNIKEDINLEVDFESKDLDYIEFSQTTPLGFDFDEVTDFISRVKYILHRYESALKQRNKELIIVASEVKKVERKMVEQNQAKELEKMIGGMTEEERLIEENMDLKVENNTLKMKLIEGDSEAVEKLKKEIKALRAENEMLMREKVQSSAQDDSEDNFRSNQSSESEFKLPNVNNDVKESKGNSLPAFSVPSEIEMPIFDEEDDDLMESKANKDSIELMMEDIGGEYDEG